MRKRKRVQVMLRDRRASSLNQQQLTTAAGLPRTLALCYVTDWTLVVVVVRSLFI